MGKWQERDEKDIHEIMLTEGVSYGRAKTRLRAAEGMAVVFFTIAAIVIIIGFLYSLPALVSRMCNHNDLNMEEIRFSVSENHAYIGCNNCRGEKRLKLSHTSEVTRQPTCLELGRKTITWSIIDFPEITHVTYEDISYGDCVISEIKKPGKAPTCTAEGYTDSGYCTWCDRFVEAKVIAKIPHSFILRGQTEPTCVKPGSTGYNCCTVCGFIGGESHEIATVAHEFVRGTYEAAYSIGSFKGELCTHCGNPGEIEEIYGPPLINEYFAYTVNEEENYVTITKALKIEDNMVIPDTINGVPVKYLSEDLFHTSKIKTIRLSENLVEIPDGAFCDCWYLEDVNIPDSVTKIGPEAFRNCYALTTLSIQNASIGVHAFRGCRSLRTVDMGLNANTVSAYAFAECVRLIYVKFSEKADKYSVDPSAFEGSACYYASVPAKSYLSETITSDICHYVEYGNYDDLIEEIDGYYYDKKSNTLIAIDNEDPYVAIPEGIIALSPKFYAKCKSPILSVVIPSTVKTIPHFESKYQNLPFRANYLNTGKVKIYYTGTEAEWEQIEDGVFLKLYDAYYVDSQGDPVLVEGEWFEVYHAGEWEYSEDGIARLKQNAAFD